MPSGINVHINGKKCRIILPLKKTLSTSHKAAGIIIKESE